MLLQGQSPVGALRPLPWHACLLSCYGMNLDLAVAYLGNLELQQSTEHKWMASAYDDLGAARGPTNLKHVHADLLVDDVAFAWNLLTLRHRGFFGSLEVERHPVRRNRLHGADDNLVFLTAETVELASRSASRNRCVMTCLAVQPRFDRSSGVTSIIIRSPTWASSFLRRASLREISICSSSTASVTMRST